MNVNTQSNEVETTGNIHEQERKIRLCKKTFKIGSCDLESDSWTYDTKINLS